MRYLSNKGKLLIKGNLLLDGRVLEAAAKDKHDE
jgi:hypothetical protein